MFAHIHTRLTFFKLVDSCNPFSSLPQSFSFHLALEMWPNAYLLSSSFPIYPPHFIKGYRTGWYPPFIVPAANCITVIFFPWHTSQSTDLSIQIGAKSRIWHCPCRQASFLLLSFFAVRLLLLQGNCVSCSPNPPLELCKPLDFNPWMQTQWWRSRL